MHFTFPVWNVIAAVGAVAATTITIKKKNKKTTRYIYGYILNGMIVLFLFNESVASCCTYITYTYMWFIHENRL